MAEKNDFPNAVTNYDRQHDPVNQKNVPGSMQYWAARPADQLIGSLSNIVNGYYERLTRYGLHYLWRRAFFTYYGIDYNLGAYHGSSAITFGGAQGELSFLKINHYRNLQQSILNMTTSQMPRWEPRAINDDVDTAEQTSVARGVLEYLMREKNLDMVFRDVVERALIYGEGFCWVNWDMHGGEPIEPKPPEPGADPDAPEPPPKHTGSVYFEALSPRNVIRNTRNSPRDAQWYIVRQMRNKYDLASTYPDKYDELIGLQGDFGMVEAFDYDYDLEDVGTQDDYDDVPVYHFYHARSPAMPDGRYMMMAGQYALTDVALPYREIPVYRCAPGDIMGSGWGYANGFDLLGPQEGYDAVYSMILTALDAHGVASVAYAEDSELTVNDLGGGLRGIRVKTMEHMPQSLALLNISEDTYRFLSLTNGIMETLSGVNETARGQSKEGESGAHAALMQSMAIMANTGMQQSYRNLLEDVGTGVVRILADYADEPQIALIIGSDQQYKVRSFKKEDIRSIDRVQVDLGNPILSTSQGKFELAKEFLANGMIKTPEQVFAVFETGRLESVYKGDYGQIETAKRENELLRKGPKTVEVEDPNGIPKMDPRTGQQMPATRSVVDGVMAILTDNDIVHIREHAEVLNNPDTRNDPSIVNAVLTHINDHMYLQATIPPPLAMALGKPAMPPSPMGMPMSPNMPAEGGANGNGGGSPAGGTGNVGVGGGLEGPGSPPPPAVAGGEMPAGLPNMPINPATGERANPLGG